MSFHSKFVLTVVLLSPLPRILPLLIPNHYNIMKIYVFSAGHLYLPVEFSFSYLFEIVLRDPITTNFPWLGTSLLTY